MRITVDAQRTEISANRKFDPARWNKKSGRASGIKEDARALNAYLDALQVKVYEAHRELINAKEEVTAEKLKNKLLGKEIKTPKMLLEVFSGHNQQMVPLIKRSEYAKAIQCQKYMPTIQCPKN